ncbi:MAG: transposon-encoded TnpW family protein [Defluviitaleaceae bacterium]|nr:transposon-encoded TnpW family protein [Defluviitaleaceae bacterium]MCL2275477.1 transposon-encoded TnpW family protein [Defluviitaleaceae bacterium]
MQKNSKAKNIQRDAEPSRFKQRIGSIIYEVGVHFKEDATETMEQKILRLIKNDLAQNARTIIIAHQPREGTARAVAS